MESRDTVLGIVEVGRRANARAALEPPRSRSQIWRGKARRDPRRSGAVESDKLANAVRTSRESEKRAELNAKARRRRGAKIRRRRTRIQPLLLPSFFAPLRLCAFALNSGSPSAPGEDASFPWPSWRAFPTGPCDLERPGS